MKLKETVVLLSHQLNEAFRCTKGQAQGETLREVSVKSVQSALSDLKRPPERLQSQRNYRPFIT